MLFLGIWEQNFSEMYQNRIIFTQEFVAFNISNILSRPQYVVVDHINWYPGCDDYDDDDDDGDG